MKPTVLFSGVADHCAGVIRWLPLRRIAALLLVAAIVPAHGQLVISNELLRVDFDTGSGHFSITNVPSQRKFVADGYFYRSGGVAAVGPVNHAVFGEGTMIDLAYSNGSHDAILLFTNLPFALFQTTLSNNTAAAVVSNKIQTVSVVVDPGMPAVSLKTLGTGGLLSPGAANSGSYAWLAVADPVTRRGVVSGWITHDRGSGVIFHQVTNSQVQVNARVDYGRLRILPGAIAPLELFAVGYFDDARLGLEAWADAVATVYDVQLPPQPAGYGTWYSSPNGGSSDEDHLAELALFASTNLQPHGFSVVQIDDHWQAGISTNGPKRNFTTNNSTYYPSGMKPTADGLKALGQVPGLWFMPFAGTYYDPFFTNQNWFVKTTNGLPYETSWGGTCLDMTHAGARTHLSNVVYRIAHEWGYEYFKCDGLWTGTGTKQQYINSYYKEDGMGDAVFSDPDKSNIEAYRDGLKLMRQVAGTNVFILGCNGPQNMRSYGGAFGLVDAMRIGPDNGSSWSSLLRGPTYGSRHYFLHGRIWYNDPDPVYVRSSMPIHHAQLICSWVSLSGQLYLNSDWLPGTPQDRVDILRRTMTGHGLLPRPVDLFENDPPRVWVLTDTNHSPRRDVIGLFNWTSSPLAFDVPLSRLGLPGSNYVGFDFWSNAAVPAISGSVQLTVPAESCRIIALRPASTAPQLLSTSRHVTQGIVDVLAENWDSTTNTLSGISKVIGGDPCELRIALPSAGWHPQSAAVSAADQAAGVTVSFTESNGLARVTVQSPAARQVAWSVAFVIGPAVALTSPANGAVFYTNDVFSLAATASAATGTVTSVSFYRGATLLGSAIAEPYALSISNQPTGIHQFTAVATDNGGNSTTSAVVQVEVIGSVPAVPSSLTAIPGNGQVLLSWNAAAGASSYNVKRSTVNGGPYVVIANPALTSFTDTGVTNRRAYYYVVSGVNPIGEGANSTQAAATPSDLVAAGLVAHLTFDDGSAADVSGHDNDGSLLNGASIVSDPQRGNVLSLDGADDYVDLGAGDSLDLGDNGQATIAAWVKMAVSKSHNSIVTKGEWRDAYSLLIKGDTVPKDRLWTGNDTGVNSAGAVPSNTWTHVAVTINGDLTTFYINGQVSGPANQDRGNAIDDLATGVSIGREQFSGSLPAGRWYFNGRMDDVRIYETALTQVEIQNVMSNALNNAPSFTSQPLAEPAATAGQPYAASITADATDPDPGDTMIFSKMSGPAWLSVAASGGLSGTPFSADAGTNSFVVRVTDANSFFDETMLHITVIPAPPIQAVISWEGADLRLTWTGGIPPYQVYVRTNLPIVPWESYGASTGTNQSILITPSNAAGFYRIQGQ